jgi:SAM-dependent methyltransferase
MVDGEPLGAPAFLKLVRCPLCQSQELARWLDGYDPHYGNSGVFPIFECGTCSVKFLNPMPTPPYLEKAYPAEYYAYQAAPGVDSVPIKILRRLIFYDPRRTGDPKFQKPGRMVDIGCGTGEFLLGMRAAGWQVEGVEMSRAAAESARRLHGLDIFGGTLCDARLPEAAFDYVRLNHSFEHMTDPIQVLAEIRRIIKPNGRLFIGVPNGASLAARMFGRYWWNLGPPVHPFTYNIASLRYLLSQGGFTVLRVGYNSNFSGLLGSCQILLNHSRGTSSSDGAVLRNPLLKLFGHWTAKAIDLLRMGDCIEITAIPAPPGDVGKAGRQ